MSISKRSLARIGLAAAVALSLAGPAARSAQPASAAAAGAAAGSRPQIRRVTTEQYVNSIANVFGPDVKPLVTFSPLQRVDGLVQLGALKAGVSESDIERFQSAAQSVVAEVLKPGRREFLLPCEPKNVKKPDERCAQRVVERFGPLIFRRPLAGAEVQQYTKVASDSAGRLGDFYKGLGVALEALLISPETLVVIEKSEPDPKAPGQLRFTAYSLASRLSYFLWNAAPDRALLDAAAKGELYTDAGLARNVDRMIASPRTQVGMRAFFADMFALDRFGELAKDDVIYPNFTLAVAEDAREQLLRTMVDQTIVKQKDYRDLYTTRDTFMSPLLSAIYQVPARPGWEPYAFDAGSPRVGIQTFVGFLADHAHPGRSSPTLRGKALRELALCQTIPPPPPDVDFSKLNNPSPNIRTQRERVAQHLENPSCASCHRAMDPPGLALENFDGSGSFRTTENGAAIDTSGALDGKPFKNVVELGTALHDHPRLPSCLVQRMYNYAIGDSDRAATRPVLASLAEGFAAEGYNVPKLARKIALSPAFSKVRSK